MGSLVLLVVAAVWVAVLVPPLLRSRLENRPNSSVSDFRAQLSSLQRAMPSSRAVSMRSMARPLAPSPLARPPAGGRPPLRSGVKIAGGGSVRSAGQEAAMRPARADAGRPQDASLRGRTHGDATRSHARPVAATDGVKRRRANILFMLVLTVGCLGFLAVTTKTPGMTYAAVGAGVGLVVYLVVLVQAAAASGRRRRPPATGPRRHAAVDQPRPARRAATPAPRYRGERAQQEATRRPEPARRYSAEWDEPAPAARPSRREHHRTQQVARGDVAEARPARRRPSGAEWGHDPRPSGVVVGEPALFGPTREARRPARSQSTVDWSPAV